MAVASVGYRVDPGGRLAGKIRVPGDKSISHRALLLGAVADGTTHVTGVLEGEDVLATLGAIHALGVATERVGPGEIVVQGVGKYGLRAPEGPLDLGNSGTGLRLMAGLLAGQAFASELGGDQSLSRRPMRRVADPLNAMGACVETTAAGTPPVTISPVASLHGIDYAMPVASAQVKSALLLAGMYADGVTRITEPAPTRDHTERMLRGMGYACESQGRSVSLSGEGRLTGTRIDVPSDLSSAAFFIVGALIAPGSNLQLENVGVNPTRTGVLDILESMGARISMHNSRTVCGEPVADLVVESSTLRGIDVPAELIPLAIDEVPVLALAAACAVGETKFSGAGELRHKESDRIAAIVQGLRALGVAVEESADGFRVTGGALSAGRVESFGDHRIAMTFAMAALVADGLIEIRDCESVATSFPGFAETARRLGLGIHVV